MKTVISFASRDDVCAGFALDLGSLCANQLPGHKISVNACVGTILPDQRSQIAAHAIKVGADNILWLDADMRFPRDTLARLLAHRRPIVAANYVTRRIPVFPVAKNYNRETDVWESVTSLDKTGLEEVSGVGFGVMLTSTEVFKKLEMPWFTFPWDTVKLNHHGEDIHFCLNAKEKGFATYIDHDLSKEVRHIGHFEFMHEHVEAE